MEIQNISGPDIMPTGFSAEKPKLEQVSTDNENSTEPAKKTVEEGRGTVIDSYA